MLLYKNKVRIFGYEVEVDFTNFIFFFCVIEEKKKEIIGLPVFELITNKILLEAFYLGACFRAKKGFS